MSGERLRLLHIRDAIARIRSFAPDKETFLGSELVQDAVVRNLEVIGEASKALADSVRSSAPEIPWREIAGMRDRLIHRYHDVDLQLVWSTVVRDLPPLEKAVERLLSRD
ncbi:MAG: HepT-like ribonuclease domain-containing protein [Thermoanaerobaculia bacterium]